MLWVFFFFFFSIATPLCKSQEQLLYSIKPVLREGNDLTTSVTPDALNAMSKLTDTSSLLPSDFNRISQGLPVLFLL